MPVALIAAVAENGVIGAAGGLPWHLPADLRRFKKLTMGHHMIVGRSTWESIGGQPLGGRTWLVVSRREGYSAAGAQVVTSVEAAIRVALDAGDSEPFVGGGTGIFRAALEQDLVDRLYLTLIHRAYDGDTRFPAWDKSRWQLVTREPIPADPATNRPSFEFLDYERTR